MLRDSLPLPPHHPKGMLTPLAKSGSCPLPRIEVLDPEWLIPSLPRPWPKELSRETYLGVHCQTFVSRDQFVLGWKCTLCVEPEVPALKYWVSKLRLTIRLWQLGRAVPPA